MQKIFFLTKKSTSNNNTQTSLFYVKIKSGDLAAKHAHRSLNFQIYETNTKLFHL